MEVSHKANQQTLNKFTSIRNILNKYTIQILTNNDLAKKCASCLRKDVFIVDKDTNECHIVNVVGTIPNAIGAKMLRSHNRWLEYVEL